MILAWLALMLSLWQASDAAMPEVTVGGFSIKLVNGSIGEGRVEVRRNATEEWGTVCGDLWDDVDAAVVCRMFGYKYGTAKRYATFSRGVGPIYMDNVDCRGNETSLVNCPFRGWGIHDCQHYQDVGVQCINQDVRIAWAGSDMGVVQIRELTGWRQVCDSQWDDLDAKVVCKQMGYDDGKAMCCSKLSSSSSYYYGYLRSSFTNFTCTGTEQFLTNCSYSTINRKCNFNNMASVICYKPVPSQADMAFSVRLQNGSTSVESPQWGMIQVRHLGKWGISCADNWNDTTANIACKQMKHQGGMAYGGTSRYLPLPSWVSSYNCTGSEGSLENCIEEPWGQQTRYCIPNGAMCYSSGPPILRLVGGTSRYGRVEITINGETGTICDNNWSDSDASVFCTSLGFVDGMAFSGSYYGRGSGSILMDGMLCNGREDSIFSCRNKGWGISDASCADHSKDASVVCHGEVRLRNGDHSSGIVQIKNRRYGYTTWKALCGNGFGDTEARVVCREMGFSNGRSLLAGSYGKYYGAPYIRNNIACTGSESSILNCSYAGSTCFSNSNNNYASVACYNGSLDNTTSVSLEGGTTAYQSKTGRVVVTKHGVKGRICQDYWTDVDASVVCRQLSSSNQGGVAYTYQQSGRGPFWLSQIGCFGNETKLSQCSVGPERCTSTRYYKDAGVLCYTSNKAPTLSLVGGTASSGAVQITYDNERGYICADKYFYSRTAEVICKQLGFTDGVARRTNLTTGGAAFMDGVSCQGSESSVFHCPNAGWRSKTTCNHQANVICYKHVKLVGGVRTASTHTGRVQLYVRNTWSTVCSSMFDDNEARVTCRELGYLYGKALSPGAFGPRTIRNSNSFGRFNCTGTETSLVNCSFTSSSSCYGRYSYSSYMYASVACSNTNKFNGFRVSIGRNFPADVTINMYGINGTVCSDGWGDEEANVVCKQTGFRSGIALRSSTSYYSTTVPRLLSGFNCTGNENDLQSCSHSTVIPSSCSSKRSGVKVVCFNTDNAIQMKLTGGISRSQGIVNIKINGQWGTICDSYFSSSDAKVVCRQLGYFGGTTKSRSLYGNGTGLAYLNSPRCTGSESKIWNCPNSGFNVTTSFCLNHNRDARVSCTGYVRLQPNVRFGAVQLYDPSTRRYGMVCAENFTNVDATVTCNELGYEYGISICCSAFGRRYASYNIVRSKISCTGREPSLINCSYERSLTYCPTRKYASVACSNTLPGNGFELQIGSSTQVYKGRVQVTYMGIKGYICPVGFDDNDATVICKMKGFNKGFAYVHRHTYGWSVNNVRWLSNIQCTGIESSLNRCGGMVWGDANNCSSVGDAAVYCYQNTGLQVRLKGTTRSSGRVEVAIEGVWGKLCYYSSSLSSRNKIADIVCREKGFEGGISTPRTRNQGTGPVYITNVYCKGTENSLKECAITWGTTFRCYHINVKCHGTVRVFGAVGRPNYGRLEMKQNNSWIPVCDDQFTDEAARVACKELDYADGKMQCCNAIGRLYYYNTKPNITITNCAGTESSLTACQYTTDVCASGNYVTVYCSATPIKVGSIVVKIDNPISKGVVNASKYGFYGPICNIGWTDTEANVTCKQTGKLGGVALYTTTRSSQPMVLGGYNCTGLETSLDDCSYKGFGEDKGCSGGLYRRRAAGVLCYNNGGIDIQLVNGTSRVGRVRILYETTWGRVCQKYLSSSTAKVACRQLGFNGGSIDRSYSTKITYSQLGKVWMGGVVCSGTESSLFQCRSYDWNPSTYSFSYGNPRCYDLGVSCYNDVRLTGGPAASAGSVEVYLNNHWGSVCDHNWSQTNTRVACKELGFDDGVRACCGAFRGSGLAIMENVRCTGSESRLLDCPHGNPHSRNCYSNNVGLVCYKGTKPTTYTWSLGGGNNYSGEVIINYLGTNGSVCSDDWDDNDARVACRELGYRHGIAYNHYRYYYSSNGPFWISKMACNGSERSLAACPTTTPLGEVKNCVSGNSAGILCTDSSGIYYRIAGGPQDNIGRVEVSVDGVWGSICQSYFNKKEVDVFCRTLGYNAGRTNRNKYPNAAGPVYLSSFQCNGNESKLADCPHRGWKKASGNTNSYCANHQYDAGIVCYEDVRLATGFAPSGKEGPIQFYANNTWNLVCDTGFTDLSAKRFCQDIGFSDGKALCCSAYGYRHFTYIVGVNLINMSMVCSGAESSSMDCLQPTVCESQSYASAICFNSTDIIDESYQYQFDSPKETGGRIDVYHYGTKGRICSTFWDDASAKVFCKQGGFRDGIAYQSPYSTYDSLEDRGPYWTSAVNCTGTEPSLLNCSFNDRLNLGNCSKADAAAAACFNDDTGIQYRLVNGTSKQNGRVEISVGGVWGTVCDYNWDDREAGVLCRHLNFSDGYAMYNAHYGQGTGPIWLSKLRCKGTETELHKCPHAGFSSEVIRSNSYRYYGSCKRHRDDASVFCVDKVRLNLGMKSNMGAVEVYHGNQWVTVCDDGFDQIAAQIVCRSLNITHGVKIAGSSFGRSNPIGVISVTCSPTEEHFSQCNQIYTGTCASGRYASVICSQAQIVDNGFKLELQKDTTRGISGYLKVQLNGVWGGVCSAGFDNKAATVACKQLGFKGGVPYKPNRYERHARPILMTDVKCVGSETSLDTCVHSTTYTSNNWCDYYSPRAGVLCYNTVKGIQYRLAGDNDTSRGRLEMSYDGQWGALCGYTNDPNISKVICKETGHVDGIMVSGARYRISSHYWFAGLYCRGNETAIPMCRNNGFNNTYSYRQGSYSCQYYGPMAVQCYDSPIKLTKVRLAGGDQSSGRVEVYLEGPNQWGTVCGNSRSNSGNSWSNDDASVVCRQLGFATGTAVLQARIFGHGTGPIWLNDVGCIGTEMNIRDCTNSGFSPRNCDHSGDVGVICNGTYVPTTPTITSPSSKTDATEGSKSTDIYVPTTYVSSTPTVTEITLTKGVKSRNQLNSSPTPGKTAAIAVPVILVLVVAGAVVGICYYKRRNRPSGLTEELVPESESGGVRLGRNVAFFSKFRSNRPTNGDIGISNPTYGEENA